MLYFHILSALFPWLFCKGSWLSGVYLVHSAQTLSSWYRDNQLYSLYCNWRFCLPQEYYHLNLLFEAPLPLDEYKNVFYLPLSSGHFFKWSVTDTFSVCIRSHLRFTFRKPNKIWAANNWAKAGEWKAVVWGGFCRTMAPACRGLSDFWASRVCFCLPQTSFLRVQWP